MKIGGRRRLSDSSTISTDLSRRRPSSRRSRKPRCIAEATLISAAQELTAAQEQAAQRRREQIQLAEQHESLRTLAELALHHLGDTCPVCAQTYDHEATRSRLSDLAGSDVSPAAQASVDPVADGAARVETAERQLADVRARFAPLVRLTRIGLRGSRRLPNSCGTSGLRPPRTRRNAPKRSYLRHAVWGTR